MKILTIHADFIEFEAKKKAFKQAEESIKEGKQRCEECLVVFTAVEKRDETDLQAITQRYVQEIKNIAQQVSVKNVVLYPYAHLSSQLSSPQAAEQVMKAAEKILQEKYKVSRAPFGWYKSFQISCKGHPLSELSREFGAEKKVDLSKEFKDELFQYNEQELTKEQKYSLTTALILAKAVQDLYPGSLVGESGLHHDEAYIDFSDVKICIDDFAKIEKQMQKIVQADLKVEVGNKDTLRVWQKKILTDLGQDKPIYMLELCSLVPTFKQPYLTSTKDVVALKITNLGSAYWKGNENNPQLTRLYVVGFSSAKKMEEYLAKKEDAENKSHLKIGKEQDLFLVSELVGVGLPLLAPKGTIIRNEITTFLWDLHKNGGYQQVWTPHIAKQKLYETSGHWDKFGDELLKVQGKSDQFVMKPMSCPHHMQIFDNFAFSYRDLPVRYFEPATIYRDEKSGQLVGLSRVRAITQDDGHLFCRITQITEETQKIVEIIHEFYQVMGMDKEYWVSLSVRGEDKTKYLGTDEQWDTAEKALENAAKGKNLPYKRIEGEAAFYGPKLDFMFHDSLGREWQLATIQCDFNLPERFDLSFMNEQGKKERPVVIHRAITGSLERFMSILIEHFAGKFPAWLSPLQVKVVTITDKNVAFAKKVVAKMKAVGIRVELDDRVESMGKKVRDAQLEKVNYIVTIGDKEVEKRTLAVRDRSGETKFGVNVDEFVAELVKEVVSRKIS